MTGWHNQREGAVAVLSVNPASKPSRLPVFLSAFVCPGAGQIVQRRWLAALVFGGGFVLCFVLFTLYALRILIAYYRLWLNFDSYQQPYLPVREAALAFLVSMVFYVVGMLDTQRAYRRICQERATRKLEASLKKLEEGSHEH